MIGNMNKGGFKSYTIWRSAGCGLMSCCLVPLGSSCVLSVNIIEQEKLCLIVGLSVNCTQTLKQLTGKLTKSDYLDLVGEANKLDLVCETDKLEK